ncbi:MAG TPA: hypothetical protein VFW86_04780 [Candidatus Limnocylindrales bacterium]|nr:hypothetical protein [Candidatus Limnocylindrales bacterium]
MYFYELHEGDSDLFTDALLAHETEYDEEEFLSLVLESRERVVSGFEEDSLVEAVAHDLERRHGFVYVDDARLTAAVNVSETEGGTFAAEVDVAAEPDEDEADLDDEGFRSLVVEIDRNPDLDEGDDGPGAGRPN